MPFGQAGQVRREWSLLRPGFSRSLPVGGGGTWTGRPPHGQCRVGETWETSEGYRGCWSGCASCTEDGNHLSPSHCIRVQLKPFLPLHLLPENSRCPVPLTCEPRGTSATLILTCSSFLKPDFSHSFLVRFWLSSGCGAERPKRELQRRPASSSTAGANHMPVIKFLISLGSSPLICELEVLLIYLSLPASEEWKVVSWDP